MTRFEDYFTQDHTVWLMVGAAAGVCLLVVAVLIGECVVSFQRWRRNRYAPPLTTENKPCIGWPIGP